jgi:parallel beta-helix repeat protein
MSMLRTTYRGGATLAIALAILLFASAPAQAAPRCGTTIVVSTTVTSDLVNCPGDGIIIGRAGITLNLNGRLVDGVGLGVGIRNPGHDDVRIVNTSATAARVQEFNYGARLNAGTLRNLVERITWRTNEVAGVELNNADSNTVRANTMTAQSKNGISLNAGSVGNVVINNTVSLNQGEGIQLLGATSNRLETNRVSGSGDRGINIDLGSNSNTLLTNTVGTSSDGAIFVVSSNLNRLERNTIDANGDAGVLLSSAASNQLITNSVRNSSDAAIAMQGSNANTLRDNDVRFNPTGISLASSARNRLESNDAVSSTGRGIELEADSFDNDLILNIASSNTAEGIYVGGVTGVATGNLLDRNTANANEADGIHVGGSGHTIRSNVARNNDGWGIFAAPGNVDGGGNRASGNAEPAQCFNVRCAL